MMNNNLKKLYVIVEYNFKDGGYRQHVVDELVFESEELANQYMKVKPFNSNMSVEELTLYPED